MGKAEHTEDTKAYQALHHLRRRMRVVYYFVTYASVTAVFALFIAFKLKALDLQTSLLAMVGAVAAVPAFGSIFFSIMDYHVARLQMMQVEEIRDDSLRLVDAITDLTMELKRRPQLAQMNLALFNLPKSTS